MSTSNLVTGVLNEFFGTTNPADMPPPPQSTGAAALVTQGFDTAQAYATNAFNEATAFLTRISTATLPLLNMAPVDGALTPIAQILAQFNVPTPPVAPTNLTLNLPSAPAQPTLTPVAGIDVSSAPEFTAVPPPIDLSFGPPGPLTAVPPTAPTLPTVTLPTEPTLTLPPVPSLIGITVPVAPLLNLPAFVGVLPDSPMAPAYTFSFSESAYTDQLLTDLKAQLDAWVNGAATGLAPAIEQAIWDRDRSREIVASQRKIGESIRSFAMRGFTKPPGALNLDIQQALQDSQGVVSSASRDVMIKQADLEQSNRRFAFETAWKVEEGLITYQNQISQRAFETAKFAQQVGIDIFHELVGRYTAQVQAYAATVEAYKAEIQAQLSLLDIYKAEIEAQRLIGEINMEQVEIYKAQVSAAQAIVEMFRTEVEAANTEALLNKTQIDAFAAQVGAYAEQVRAKAAEYDMYATHVKAEVSKIDVFTAQAQAYDAQVNGFKATVEALVSAKNIEMDVSQRLPIDVFKALTDVYRVQVGAEVDRVDAVNKTYATAGEVFAQEMNAIKAEADVAVAATNMRIEAAKANVQLITEQVTLLVEAIKGGAQVAAQIAAAALSAVNLSGQIGDHVSYGVGYNVSDSSQISSSTNSNTSTQTSTSFVTEQINTTANNTNNNTSNQTANDTQTIFYHSL